MTVISYRGARLTKKKEDGAKLATALFSRHHSDCITNSVVAVSVNFPVIVRRLYAVRVSVAIAIR